MENNYNDCLEYINSYWNKIIFKPVKKKLNNTVINIPHSFITPNDKKFKYIFYWDTFFIFKGLPGTKYQKIMKPMVNNFIYLFNKYGIVPNFNSPTSTGRSQPPFLTSMILDVYNTELYRRSHSGFFKKFAHTMSGNRHLASWLKKSIQVAKKEYETVWLDPEGTFHHRVEDYSLSRYGDTDLGYALSSELESGWDFTSRFYNRCNDFLPIDLNCYLYKYETDFAKTANMLKNKNEKEYWEQKAYYRKEDINKLMWNEKEGFFFDYGHYYQIQSDFLSLAGFTPLWAGLATLEQAQKMLKKLKTFETEYGLLITAKESLAPKINLAKIPKRYIPALKSVIEPKQWDYPNIWSPLEYLTVIGLLKYGFFDDAKRIMQKSVNTHAGLFRKYGVFFEKINGITGDRPDEFQYKTQTGFGWTNAVFYRYTQILKSLEENEPIYDSSKTKTPPYELLIFH